MTVGGVELQLHPVKFFIVEKLLTIAAGWDEYGGNGAHVEQ